MDAFWAKVTAVFPAAHSVDLVRLSDGAYYRLVPVLASNVSSNTGKLSIPTPTPGVSNQSAEKTNNRDVYALVVPVDGSVGVIGFKVPERCAMTFAEVGLLVDRHESDWYTMVDVLGNFEAYHPSGSYISLGTGNHRDLTGLDLDGLWAISNNTSTTPTLTVSLANAGSQVAKITIDPSGDITVTNHGNLSVTTTGGASVTAASATINAPTAINGNLTVSGSVVAGGNVTGGGISLDSHTHSGVQAGSGNSGGPH